MSQPVYPSESLSEQSIVVGGSEGSPLPLKNLSDQRIPQQNILNLQLTTSEIIHSSVCYNFHLIALK